MKWQMESVGARGGGFEALQFIRCGNEDDRFTARQAVLHGRFNFARITSTRILRSGSFHPGDFSYESRDGFGC